MFFENTFYAVDILRLVARSHYFCNSSLGHGQSTHIIVRWKRNRVLGVWHGHLRRLHFCCQFRACNSVQYSHMVVHVDFECRSSSILFLLWHSIIGFHRPYQSLVWAQLRHSTPLGNYHLLPSPNLRRRAYLQRSCSFHQRR